MRGIRLLATGIEPASLRADCVSELPAHGILTVYLVTQAPAHNARMIPVPRNHLAHLLDAILFQFLLDAIPGVLESRWAPSRHFLLHKDSVPVTVVEPPPVLCPVHPGKDAIQFLHIAMVGVDPDRRFGHAIVRMAARHALQ